MVTEVTSEGERYSEKKRVGGRGEKKIQCVKIALISIKHRTQIHTQIQTHKQMNSLTYTHTHKQMNSQRNTHTQTNSL